MACDPVADDAEPVEHLALVEGLAGHEHVALVVFDEEHFDRADGFSQHRRSLLS